MTGVPRRSSRSIRATGANATIATVVSMVACLAAVALISLVTPVFGAESRYVYDRVRLGERGELREFDATATGVRLTRSIDKYGDPLTTDHVYVVVTVEADVRTDTQYFTHLELRTGDGHRYDPRPEWSTAAPPITQPGFSARGDVVFEVPAGRVADARLFIGPLGGEVTRYDAAVLVDLGLVDRGLGKDVPIEPGPLTLADGTVWVTR